MSQNTNATLSYLQRLSKEGQEAAAAKQLELKARAAKLKWDGDTLKTEEALEQARQDLETELNSADLDSAKVLKAKEKVSSLEKGLEFLQTTGKELFPNG